MLAPEFSFFWGGIRLNKLFIVTWGDFGFILTPGVSGCTPSECDFFLFTAESGILLPESFMKKVAAKVCIDKKT